MKESSEENDLVETAEQRIPDEADIRQQLEKRAGALRSMDLE